MKIWSYLSVTGLILFACSCREVSEKQPSQGDNFWVVLERAEASETGGQLSWDFKLNKPGSYQVQIISEGELDAPLPELSLQTGGVLLTEAPEQIFVLNVDGGKKTVSQFNRRITFKESGVQSLNVDAHAAIQQIRMVPPAGRNLGFGTGTYEEEWSRMFNSPEKQAALNWLKEAKYGMFIHWGLYSQAGGMWKGTPIEDSPFPGPRVAEWLMSTFQIPRAEYEKLAESFNPDRRFAEEIATLAADAGMNYVVITSKHHDGFALFDSECSAYDMVDATPYQADAISELYQACLARGLKFGVYYSHGNDWYDGTDGNHAYEKRRNDSLGLLSHMQGKNHWDPSPNIFQDYLDNKAYPQIEELLKLMPELALIWFDGDGNISEDQAFKFYKIIYDMNPHVLVSRRVGYEFGDYLDAGDNVIPSASDKLAKQWETCGTTNNSWGYKAYDDDWKSTPELLYYLIDIASKGGNYLLNIGPDGKGQVPEASARGLREVGDWLQVNGKAIYGTSRWKIPSEGQEETLLEGTGHRASRGFHRTFNKSEFWFTAIDNKVYAISLVPAPDTVRVQSLKSENGSITSVRLLGNDRTLEWTQSDTELLVDLHGVETGAYGYALELSME
jgi:alpha-L-fucosidase